MPSNRKERGKQKLRYQSARERVEKHEKKFELTAITLPAGTSLFRFTKARTYRLDVLPYVVGEGNPFCDPGFLHYERTFYAHRFTAPTGSVLYSCLAHTFHKPCPICEELARYKRMESMSDDDLKDMRAKENQLMNVIDLDDPEKGIQILSFNWWELGKIIDTKIKAKPEKYENFFHLEGGRTLEVATEENRFRNITRYKPVVVDFDDVRKKNYDEEIMERVYNLDLIPKEVPYAELKNIFLQTSPEVEEEPEEVEKDDPVSISEQHTLKVLGRDDIKKKVLNTNGLKEGDFVKMHGEQFTVKRIRKDGLLTLEDDDGDFTDKVDPKAVARIATQEDQPDPDIDEEEDMDEDEIDDTDDDDQDDDDFDSDDETEAKSRKKK